MHTPRRLLLLALALVAVPLALPGAASAAAARAAACPTFTVLHNDRIGSLSLPAGGYRISPRGLSCAAAATNFANFLNYPSGLLPSPWRLNSATRTFSNGGGQSFTVTRGGTPPTPPTPPTGRCSNTFSVLHNDRIGSLALRKGEYYLNVRNLGCLQAASLFAEFLDDWDGILPSPWRVIASQRRFVGGSRSFVVTRKDGGGGTNPSGQRLCPGTFRVLHNDRIGRLAIPKGSYYVWLLPGRSVNCALAYSNFSQFLARTDGKLPSPWTLDASSGTFLRGRTNPPNGFRIDPGSSTGGTTPP